MTDQILAARNQIKQLGIVSDLFVSDAQGMALMCHMRFAKPETYYEQGMPSDLLSLHMCTANFGKVNWFGNDYRLHGTVKPGTVGVSVPQGTMYGSIPKINMLGIAVSLESFNRRMACDYRLEQFSHATANLYNDPVLTSVMQALWQDAKVHGEISAFFEHGIAVVLKRLVSLSSQVHNDVQKPMVSLKLSPRELQNITDFIENKALVGSNICVKDMAKAIDLEPRTFCRAFSATTGYAPYAYFTKCRINVAQRLLTESNLSITAIANEMGYSNASKFSFIFKKNCGLSPREWRRNHAR